VRYTETVEIRGHIMDTGVLARVLDDVLEYGGDYTIARLDLGRQHHDESYARVEVGSGDPGELQRILMRLQIHGVNQVDPGVAVLRPAERDGVFPDDFCSTTNLETRVRIGGQWLPVQQPEMDCGLLVTGYGTGPGSAGHDPAGQGVTVRTVPVSDVRAGDQIVCGASGVRVVLPALKDDSNQGGFGFMSSDVSSEKPQALQVHRVAEQMREAKAAGRRILWVGGPAIVHTGAAPAMAALVRAGYVDVLFAGNALATHDIESALFGTSLGMDLAKGRGVPHGHEHHIRAINTIRRCGSIAAAVKDGVLTSGVMHALVECGRDFVLVGSVRDDGPLPDVYADVIAGQRAMRAQLAGVGFCIVVATMLHGIATGNILPASIPLVCVDINPATVTKLADRGSAQAIGIVTDIGLFFEQLARELVVGYRGPEG
jgi:lysine-ketoglutarate reductase/saccharopine dehydrogenase-like protein (TIGR00300 family)